MWPKEECIPLVGRGLGKGHQAHLQVPPCSCVLGV